MPNNDTVTPDEPSKPKGAKLRYTAKIAKTAKSARKRKTYAARSNGKAPGGRRTAYSQALATQICATLAEGHSLAETCRLLNLPLPTVKRWLFTRPQFRADYAQAREVRCDNWAEEIVDIADHRDGDYELTLKGNVYQVREAVHRSKLRMEGRQWVMSRLLPQQWGEKQQIDIKSDWALLSEDERRRKADELIQMIRELKEPPMQPPPLVYRGEEAPEEPEPGESGWQPRSAAGPVD
jgi:hypothetical protein